MLKVVTGLFRLRHLEQNKLIQQLLGLIGFWITKLVICLWYIYSQLQDRKQQLITFISKYLWTTTHYQKWLSLITSSVPPSKLPLTLALLPPQSQGGPQWILNQIPSTPNIMNFPLLTFGVNQENLTSLVKVISLTKNIVYYINLSLTH